MADSRNTGKDMNALAVSVTPIVNDRTLVLKALNNDDFMWRTAEGIARETDLSLEAVNSVLSSLSDSLIQSAVPNENGRTRYTTLEHYRAHAGILRRVLDTLSDQVR
jgi:hypothetical protein